MLIQQNAHWVLTKYIPGNYHGSIANMAELQHTRCVAIIKSLFGEL